MKRKLPQHHKSLRRFAYWTFVYEIVVVFLFAYYVRNKTTVAANHL